jgi:hypothetical protein
LDSDFPDEIGTVSCASGAVCLLFDKCYEAPLPSEDQDEANANAHLIAAAPDLFEALEDLAGLARAAMLDANRGGCEYEVDGELADARAALAKARGETP